LQNTKHWEKITVKIVFTTFCDIKAIIQSLNCSIKLQIMYQ
jgi:hypothetical protein